MNRFSNIVIIASVLLLVGAGCGEIETTTQELPSEEALSSITQEGWLSGFSDKLGLEFFYPENYDFRSVTDVDGISAVIIRRLSSSGHYSDAVLERVELRKAAEDGKHYIAEGARDVRIIDVAGVQYHAALFAQKNDAATLNELNNMLTFIRPLVHDDGQEETQEE